MGYRHRGICTEALVQQTKRVQATQAQAFRQTEQIPGKSRCLQRGTRLVREVAQDGGVNR